MYSAQNNIAYLNNYTRARRKSLAIFCYVSYSMYFCRVKGTFLYHLKQ